MFFPFTVMTCAHTAATPLGVPHTRRRHGPTDVQAAPTRGCESVGGGEGILVEGGSCGPGSDVTSIQWLRTAGPKIYSEYHRGVTRGSFRFDLQAAGSIVRGPTCPRRRAFSPAGWRCPRSASVGVCACVQGQQRVWTALVVSLWARLENAKLAN